MALYATNEPTAQTTPTAGTSCKRPLHPVSLHSFKAERKLRGRTKDSALGCRGCLSGLRSEGRKFLKIGRGGEGLEPEAVGPEEEALRDDMATR